MENFLPKFMEKYLPVTFFCANKKISSTSITLNQNIFCYLKSIHYFLNSNNTIKNVLIIIIEWIVPIKTCIFIILYHLTDSI